MTKKPGLRMGKDTVVEVTDPHQLTPIFADVITEARLVQNVVYLSLGNLLVEGDTDSSQTVQSAVRLRMSVDTARSIAGTLAGLLQPPARSQDSQLN